VRKEWLMGDAATGDDALLETLTFSRTCSVALGSLAAPIRPISISTHASFDASSFYFSDIISSYFPYLAVSHQQFFLSPPQGRVVNGLAHHPIVHLSNLTRHL
jgi:hypothetical protein